MRKVIFNMSPTGLFGLGYNIGESAEFEEKQAEELVATGYAQYDDETDPAGEDGKEGKAKQSKDGKKENASDKGPANSEKS